MSSFFNNKAATKSERQTDGRNRFLGALMGTASRSATLVALLYALALSLQVTAAEPSLPEYQVKSIFLLNFAKYVDWPAEAFATESTPIVIGILGENKIGKDLESTVQNKNVGRRKIIVRPISQETECTNCHILFIGSSERKKVPDILEKVGSSPVLTVSEIDQFTDQGGIIRFLKREEKIRLEINLRHAKQARLQISSKLLSVADSVKGKQ